MNAGGFSKKPRVVPVRYGRSPVVDVDYDLRRRVWRMSRARHLLRARLTWEVTGHAILNFCVCRVENDPYHSRSLGVILW